jgi:hypothetical protein
MKSLYSGSLGIFIRASQRSTLEIYLTITKKCGKQEEDILKEKCQSFMLLNQWENNPLSQFQLF